MNTELRNLYQDLILDHGKHPRHFHKLEPHTHCEQGYNPLCGDQLTLYMNIEDGKIADIGFTGRGCAISMASASMMSQALKGKSVEEAQVLFDAFRRLVTENDSGQACEKLGKLCALAGVKEFPSRVKCATLPWHTMDIILHERDKPAA